MVVDCWLLTRTLAPKKRACDMLRHICLHHQNSITGSCKAFALQHFRVSESTTFIGFFKCNLSRQKLSYFLNNHAIIKSKHVIFMILIALTDVTNYESWIPEVNAFRRLSIPPSKVLGTARLSYAVGARLFTHIWCAWTPWCEFIWVGQGLPEPCSNTTGYGGVNADVVKLDHIFDHLFTTTIVGPDVVVTLWNWYMGAIFSLWTSSMDEISGGKKKPSVPAGQEDGLAHVCKELYVQWTWTMYDYVSQCQLYIWLKMIQAGHQDVLWQYSSCVLQTQLPKPRIYLQLA